MASRSPSRPRSATACSTAAAPADMKSAIAAFVHAASRYLGEHELKGSISLLITGDEEGPAINGTPKMLDWLKARGETARPLHRGRADIDRPGRRHAQDRRRGSLTARITVAGVQGHVGYPHKAVNPIPAMAALVERLSSHTLDEGTGHFEKSTLSFTTVDGRQSRGQRDPRRRRASSTSASTTHNLRRS